LEKLGKQEWRTEIAASMDKAQAFFLVHCAGMTVEQLTELRVELRPMQASMAIVKNTIAKKAIEGRDESIMTPYFKGQVGVVYAYGDVAAAAKVFSQAIKKFEHMKAVAGYMEKAVLTAHDIEDLASLPPREVLIGQIVGSLVAPHRGLLGILNGVQRNLVQVLAAIKDKKTA